MASLARAGFSSDYTPWLIVLVGIALVSVTGLLPARNSQPPLDFVPLRLESNVSLADSLALTYAALSLMTILLLLQAKTSAWRPLESRQFIDIELTSSNDFENKKELLPSTEPKPSLRKRHGSLADRLVELPPDHGMRPPTAETSKASHSLKVSDFHAVPAPLRAPSKPPRSHTDEPVFVIKEQPKASDLPPQRVSFKDLTWPAKVNFVAHRTDSARSADNEQIQIEEVAPAKLLEVTDNDGDTGSEIWQAGGRSAGGKGARSVLASYLRELHLRLKRAWSPPTETPSGKAEILFRLRKDGQLCSIKLATSSGDAAVDQSALAAISSCAPFAHLPDDYGQDYLDLRYTFNYTANELKAIDNLGINATE